MMYHVVVKMNLCNNSHAIPQRLIVGSQPSYRVSEVTEVGIPQYVTACALAVQVACLQAPWPKRTS